MPRISFCFIAALLASVVQGQILTPILESPPQAATYTGPLNLTGTGTNIVACFSIRACSAALRGTKAIRACDASDVHCADVLSDATTGALVIPTANPSCTTTNS